MADTGEFPETIAVRLVFSCAVLDHEYSPHSPQFMIVLSVLRFDQ